MEQRKIEIYEYLKILIITVTIIVSIFIVSTAFVNRNKESEIINVTGLGSKDFESDLIVWSGSFYRLNTDIKKAYEELYSDQKAIIEFLKEKDVSQNEYVLSSVTINKEYESVTDKENNQRQVFKGYSLQQKVTIESTDINKIESVSREITDLINKGVEFYSNEPEYYYTKLSELKMELIESATNNARERAEAIAEKSGSKLGKLKYANMGVVQILGRNSNEDYSWDGIYNTNTRLKTATITMKLQFGIK